ncbi:hypothetical protein EAI_07725 [Harpegnathos saltator]|uniref:Uncharacterized protein n=1 Tax=Harpegnathos saltator TaxID=610380 RepID=E2B512_HARSA|nr:hypothetical protein EAI_07725 [Harpegnathos saltator]
MSSGPTVHFGSDLGDTQRENFRLLLLGTLHILITLLSDSNLGRDSESVMYKMEALIGVAGSPSGKKCYLRFPKPETRPPPTTIQAAFNSSLQTKHSLLILITTSSDSLLDWIRDRLQGEEALLELNVTMNEPNLLEGSRTLASHEEYRDICVAIKGLGPIKAFHGLATHDDQHEVSSRHPGAPVGHARPVRAAVGVSNCEKHRKAKPNERRKLRLIEVDFSIGDGNREYGNELLDIAQ